MLTTLALALSLVCAPNDDAYSYCAVTAGDAPGEYYEPFVECLESIGWEAGEAREEADTIRCFDDNMCCEDAITC